MENIEIDPVKEMQHLQAMYIHYKKLYRKIMVFMLLRPERKLPKQKRDEYKQKIQRVIEERCKKKCLDLFFRIYIYFYRVLLVAVL